MSTDAAGRHEAQREADREAAGEEILRLASVDNFRDVAGPGTGPGYATRSGGVVRRGVFYRSNALDITPDEVTLLAGLGLRTILDLRTPHEIERHPDPEVPGCAWHHYDIFGIPMDHVAALTEREAALEVMHGVYRQFVDSPATREGLAAMFRQLAEGGPQLFHCSAGKDRTGWAAALLLHIAGVDDTTIEADYLLTNTLAVESRRLAEAAITEALGPEHVDVFEPTLVADLGYLRTSYDAVEELYGDRMTYLREGLGLDEATIEALRSHLAEPA